MSAIHQALLMAVAAGGGGSAEPRQTTSTVSGNYGSVSVSFPSAVLAGSLIVIYTAGQDGFSTAVATLVTDQSDTVVYAPAEGWGGSWTGVGYIASAVGGTTQITFGSGDQRRATFYAEEWEGYAYDSGAGVGFDGPANFTDPTPTTPNAITSTPAFSASSFTIRAGITAPGQTVPTGWTEGGRYTSGDNYGQLVGGYRVESTGGAKSAEWISAIPGDGVSAQIRVFREV